MAGKKNFINADKAGIASALLCTVHCMVIPALFLIKVWWGANNLINVPPWWERIDYFFLIISFWAVYHAAAHARAVPIRLSLWLFWGVLAVAIIFEKSLHWLAYIASAGLITTHFINLRHIFLPVRKEFPVADVIKETTSAN